MEGPPMRTEPLLLAGGNMVVTSEGTNVLHFPGTGRSERPGRATIMNRIQGELGMWRPL